MAPSVSKSQERLFQMVHAYQKGELKGKAPAKIKEVSSHILESDAKDFAKGKEKGLPEKKGSLKVRILEAMVKSAFARK